MSFIAQFIRRHGITPGRRADGDYGRAVKIELRTTLPEAEHDALDAWVNEHSHEFDTLAVYREGLTIYRVGEPPLTVVHHPDSIATDLDAVLASIHRGV